MLRYCHECNTTHTLTERCPQAPRRSGHRRAQHRPVVMARAAGICEWPGCTEPAQHVDHIQPLAYGGTDDLDNLQALCATHNLTKGATWSD